MIILSEVTGCLVRDFNVFLFPLDRLHCNVFCGRMTEFLEFIANLNLVDFLLEGTVYTWSNNLDPPLLS